MNWQGKSALVTGAGGFIGSHLAEELARRGAAVRALVHYNALGTRGWLSDDSLGIEVVAGDVCDMDSIAEAMKDVEIVFHLAALIAIPYSYRVPRSYVHTNVVGTVHVLQAARQARVARVVHASTSEVYGTAQYVPIDEKHPLQAQSPYSASKIAGDKLAESFHLSYGVPVVTVRPFNTYGPRQSARAIIPTIVMQCLGGGPVRLGNLHPTRDLSYVQDTVRGFMLAGQSRKGEGQVINLGSGREISIGDLAQLIGRLMNRTVHVESDRQRIRPPGSEVDRLVADSSRALSLLGWESSVSLEEGLARTIEWIQKNQERYGRNNYVV